MKRLKKNWPAKLHRTGVIPSPTIFSPVKILSGKRRRINDIHEEGEEYQR